MPYFEPQPMRVKCPNCGAELTVPVFTIIDAKDMPDAVQALIIGALNVFQCPQCGTSGLLDVPLMYHHGEKQLAYLYFPTRVNMPQPERQKIIGEITRALMRTLPEDHPKGYLLRPREFLTLPSFLDAVMEAEGIDKEILEERRRKGEIIDKLLAVVDDNLAFSAVVGQYKDKLDAEFYELLRYARETAQLLGHKEEAEKLERLRQKLLPLTEAGKRERALDKAVEFLRSNPDRKQFLQRLLEAEDDIEVEALVKVARPLADYAFFQMLSERIRQAERQGDKEKAKRLSALRDRVLEITQTVDKATEDALNQAAALLRTLLSAPNLEKAIEDNLDKIDDTFLFVLTAQLQDARKRGMREIANSLQRVWNAVRRKLRPDVPPEILIIEDLMGLDYPDGTREYLELVRDELSNDLFTLMEAVAADLERQGMKEEAKRLRAIRGQAMGVLAASTA